MVNSDVVIVGGGPAGLMAGITLQKKQISCKVFEKSLYPRKKLCGGMLTQKAVDLLQQNGLDVLESGIKIRLLSDFQVFNNGEFVTKVKCDKPFYLIERIQFDAWLADYYLKLGGELHVGEKITHVNFEDKQISSPKGNFKYDVLIASDGCNSIFTKNFAKKQPKALCLEVDVPNDQISDEYENIITLDLGMFKSGYGWCFPAKDVCRIGIGSVEYDKVQYKELFTKYLNRFGSNKNPENFDGAFVPYGACDGIVSFTQGKMLVIGDAAGFVDPLTGEGIYYALKSGNLAATAIADNQSYLETEKQYHKQIQIIIDEVNRSQKYRDLFFVFKDFVCHFVKRHNTFLKFICDKQIAYNSYGFRMFKMALDHLCNKG